MYDAVNAYGLPSAIIDLDRAAQTDTRCYIRTAHGITEPITITGVTKQGGSLSPVKSTLTTSLGHHFINDLMSSDPDALIITPGQSQRADPHLPDDKLQAKIVMAEATDDSYLFSRSLTSLRRCTLEMERFQFAYGWLTQWAKSLAYVLEPKVTPPTTIELDSITNAVGINPLTITAHTVKLISNELDFLRAKVDDPRARYEELKIFIEEFTFPKFSRRPPITLLRKIVKQNIVSKARALLSLQPIKRIDAEDLDKCIKAKIHMESGMPFMPSSDILTLPIDLHGLDFPSISRINDGIAIDGLHRDLNHPIPSYQKLARITLADWTCCINNCTNPIENDGLTRDFTRYAGKIPYGWITAQSAMKDLPCKLTLKRTNIDGILSGEVSLSHVTKTFAKHIPTALCPDGTAINTLRNKGIRMLNNMGAWRIHADGKWTIDVKPRPTTSIWTDAAKRNWDKLSNVLRCTNINWFSLGQTDLLYSREDRRQRAEASIRQMAVINRLPPSLTTTPDASQVWGSDGSMTPAAAGILDPKSVTAAVTGPQTLVLKIEGRNISILQGELVGLIMCLILAPSDEHESILYSDHLNSTRLIDDSKTAIDQRARLRGMNGRSYYRWILRLVADNPLKIVYTPGHSSERHIRDVFTAPVPTFFMDEFTFFTHDDGWIESNIRNFIDKSRSLTSSKLLAAGHQQRMAIHLYDPKAPPEYSYTRAYSAYSAVVQLYARSGQLATADLLYSRDKLDDPNCRAGCNAIEDQHHIFVECTRYAKWREKATEEILSRMGNKLDEQGIEEADRVGLLATVKSLFSDDASVWPLQYSVYYLGHLPKFDHLLPKKVGDDDGKFTHTKLAHHLAYDWHTAAIRLTGRIWGDWQKEMVKKTDTRGRRR
ncbi:hypothetical protein DFH09DRAFT_1035307 [Mycena vulgaris]|nr:hypothetical protein DFH09DRAFT_1035307 [Mycena vulgaris]